MINTMKIKNINELNTAIFLLKNKQIQEEILLKEQFKVTYESLRPVNFLRNVIKELFAVPDFKQDIIESSMSILAGYFSRKIAVGNSINPFKLLLGSIIQLGVTTIISKNSSEIKSTFMEVFTMIFDKTKKNKNE
jgi:hypothetical protein